MKISVKNDVIILIQKNYMLKILIKFEMINCNLVTILMKIDVANTLISSSTQTDQKIIKWFQQMTEFLMWSLIYTRLDLSYSVEILSRYAFNSSEMHYNLLKWILRYVIDTVDFDITFSKNVESEVDLIAYSDSNFADLKNKQYFISEYVMMLINESISYASRR
jgi:hypothetical protein